MTGATAQALVGFGGYVEGTPQNQSGGVNNSFQPDGTNKITTGVNATPVNWNSVAPLPGIGAAYWIKFTQTGGLPLLAGPGVGSFANMASAIFPNPNGVGSSTFSYQISSSSTGAPVVASGTGTTNNTI